MSLSVEGLVDLPTAVAWRDALHAAGKRVVFTSGCFDILHAGHVRYLRQARALGDALIVAMNNDDSVRALKGPDRPINHHQDRAEVLLGLTSVDAVIVFSSERTTSMIDAIRPHIFAKGGDYTIASLNAEERCALQSYGAVIQILPEVTGKSTTATLSRMGESKLSLTKLPLTSMPLPRLAILGSGTGSNFDAIAGAIATGAIAAEIVLVVSDVADAPILEKAHRRGIPSMFIDPGPWKTKLGDSAQKEFADRLLAARPDAVICAGFMRRLKSPILSAFKGRILNIHPSLLPAFPGRNAIAQALAAGVVTTGCTVHLVTEEIDAGDILAQGHVPVFSTDTHETLARRVHETEHRIFPEAISRFLASLSAGDC